MMDRYYVTRSLIPDSSQGHIPRYQTFFFARLLYKGNTTPVQIDVWLNIATKL